MAKDKKESNSIINEGNLGSLLREYREIAGYSLTQMAEALCLSDETLEHLESEDFHSLPEPPYVRGYLRNYAKLAEKDPAELITSYESLRGADPSDLDYHFKTKPTILSDSKRKISPVMGQLILLSLLLAFIVGVSMIPAVNNWITNTWASFSDQTRSQDNMNNQDLIGTMPIPTSLGLESNQTNKATQDVTVDTDNSTTTDNTETQKTTTNTANNEPKTEEKQTDTATTATNTTTQQEAKPNTEQAVDDSQTTSTSDSISIKLIFNKEVWMKVKDGTNKTVFEGLNAAGGSKNLELKKPLHFRVGNAHGLSLFVDDKAVDISSYIKGSVAKFSLE